MKGWIKLTVLCDTLTSYKLEKLGIEPTAEHLQYKPYSIQISQIGGIGENIDIKGSFVIVSGKSLEAKETPEAIERLITINDIYSNINSKQTT